MVRTITELLKEGCKITKFIKQKAENYKNEDHNEEKTDVQDEDTEATFYEILKSQCNSIQNLRTKREDFL